VSYLFYPNLTQNCPNVSHCPHLGGAALGSVVSSANANDEWLQALLRQIDGLRYDNDAKRQKIEELQRQVEQLKVDLKVERQKQFQRTVADEPVGGVVDATNAGAKKRGAPVGHPGWFRPRPRHFDRIVSVPSPTRCPHCQGMVKARPDLPAYDHLQEDWLDGLTATICFRHEEGRCTKCRHLGIRETRGGECAAVGPRRGQEAAGLRSRPRG
jgi:transposase